MIVDSHIDSCKHVLNIRFKSIQIGFDNGMIRLISIQLKMSHKCKHNATMRYFKKQIGKGHTKTIFTYNCHWSLLQLIPLIQFDEKIENQKQPHVAI